MQNATLANSMFFRILVADDHAVVRKGIINILERCEGLRVQDEVSNGDELLQALKEKADYHAVVMDLHMPGLNGLPLVRQIRAIRPDLPILVLTIDPENVYALRLLQTGVAGYLTKESVTDELVTAVQKICRGGRYVSPALAEQIAFTSKKDMDRPPHERLSDREFEVLRLLAEGLTPTQIADRLGLSVKTVSTYRIRILDKMQMLTNAEIMKYAMKTGLVE
jgi:two-component system invasion response regulator UvrY